MCPLGSTSIQPLREKPPDLPNRLSYRNAGFWTHGGNSAAPMWPVTVDKGVTGSALRFLHVKPKPFEPTVDVRPEGQGKTEHSCRAVTIFYCRPNTPTVFSSSQKCTSNCFCMTGSGTIPINLRNAYMKLHLHNLGILINKILHRMESYCQ